MIKTYFYVAAMTMVLAACSSSEEYSDMSINENYSLKVSANASGVESGVSYPVTVSAYGDGGSVQSQTITSEGASATLTLQKGKYTITASSGEKNFPNGYTTSSPLMMAVQENVQMTKDTELPLTMSYRVASVSVSLSDIEDNVTAVTVTFNTMYADISEKGELGGSVSPVISCTKGADGVWKTGTFYVLPSVDANTKFVITKQYANETKTNSVTIGKAIEAGKIYNFNGRYDDTYAKYKIQVTLSAEGWKETLNEDFTFDDKGETTTTPGGNTGTDSPGTGGTDTPSVDASLTAGTVWNGHVVALVEGNTATLLSTKEWTSLTALPTDIESYTEGEYSGWTVPTEDEGKAIAQKYSLANSLLSNFNKILEQNSVTALSGSDKVRYLCADGTRAYSFYNPASAINVNFGSNSYGYRLRLIKKITIK